MKEKDYCITTASADRQEVSFNSKGRRMQMNVLRTKPVSHVGSLDDHGQPIAGGDGQRCRRRFGNRQGAILYRHLNTWT